MMQDSKKIAFGGVAHTGMVPKPFSLAEILRASPTILHVIELLSGDGVECKIGKGFASFQFYGMHGVSGAQDIARADYVATAINGLRPKHMFEQVVSVRGSAASIDIDQLRKVCQVIEAEIALSETTVTVEMQKRLDAVRAVEDIIHGRKLQSQPVNEGFDDMGKQKRRAVREQFAF